jgi:hypothetical protein
MRWIPDASGRFPRRPYWERDELDARCEAVVTEFLRARRGRPRYPITTDELTILVECYADLDSVADLSPYGEDVEGYTDFSRRPPLVRVSERFLDPRLENRLRTTLTHELGHVLLHVDLFSPPDPRQLLFLDPPDPAVTGCKRDTLLRAPGADWMEWQAGYACGAFLMPASAVHAVARAALSPIARPVSPEDASLLVSVVVAEFAVSAEAARVRLEQLGYLREGPSFPF